jgi:hypothetical protein
MTKNAKQTPALHKVESSQIAAIGHDNATNTLHVQFKSGGPTYSYAGVSAEKFAALKGAKSIGSHFAAHIKGVHEFKKQGAK